MSNLKLAVDVVRAHNLIPKDGKGSSNAFVELSFDGHKFRTTVKEKDLDPFWGETFVFNLLKPNDLQNLTLEAHVYSSNKVANSKSSLGKVKITGASFVPYSDAALCNYPLEKGGMFSKSRGELGLKVYMTDDTYVKKSSVSVTEIASSSHSSVYSSLHELPPEKVEKVVTDRPSSIKKGTKRTFFTLPDSNSQRQEPPHTSTTSQPTFGVNEMRPEPQGPQVIHMQPGQPTDTIKETSPVLGGGQVVGGRVKRSDKRPHVYDLVEPMQFLFVRVVKARNLPMMDLTGSLDPYVEVKVGNYKGVTRHFDKTKNPEWNTVFTFSEDRLQASLIEISVKDKDTVKDDLVGTIRYAVRDVPTRVPPDSPLAPEWYHIVDDKGEKDVGELMIAVWMGTQADEAFPDAWHSDFASVIDSSVSTCHTRSKVYHSPRLWYVRVIVIEAQDMILSDKSRFPNLHVKAQIGNQILKSKTVQSQTTNVLWNEEDMLFVAAEPFDEALVLSVEDHVGPNKDEVLGRTYIPLTTVQRRTKNQTIHPKWFNLQKPSSTGIEEPKKDKFASRIHIRVCLDGGYHVLDEPIQYSSDFRPSAKQLWKSPVGILELGILNANAVTPMKSRDGRGTTDSFCVAKYGQKWVRTRTIIDNLNPKYNEQYTWDVYDPATVLTVGVFDNGQIDDKGVTGNKDLKIGKVRIRISTLKTGHVYTHYYPLLVLHPSSGIKKMGELHLAIRFSCTSMVNIVKLYSKPFLPKMHFVKPFSMNQTDVLRHHAVKIIAARLIRSEPPLRKEVTEYMSDAHSQLWSMRRSKANFNRLLSVFSWLTSMWTWFGEVCAWKNPVTTVLVHILFVMLMCYTELILPTTFFYMFLIGLWNYRYRPPHPPHMDIKLSGADSMSSDELDEEFDVFPTSRGIELVRYRYDRLRIVSGRNQTWIGDIASQGEKLQAVLSWRDPRATMIFMAFCMFATFVLYVIPFQVLVIFAGLWAMRHPKFRHKIPSSAYNFFRRLPARTDSLM